MPCAQCMPPALHSLPPASCHWPWVVLFGFTFFLSQTSGVVLWHGFSMCCWPLALSVAIVAPLAICSVLSACPLPSTLCPLPATGLVWSCSVLPSFCPRHLLWFCVMASACVASLLCYLLQFAAFWQPALCPIHTLCPPLCALCVAMWGVTSAAPQLELFPLLMS